MRWTIYAAIVLYVLALACQLFVWLAAIDGARRREPTRSLWTAGWLAFFVHVLLAFDVYHGWSHAAAMAHVEQISGFGPGIFVSYAFTLLWGLDVAWWWLAPTSRELRPIWISLPLHAFLAFIMFNGAVVFESGPSRWLGVSAIIILFTVFSLSRKLSGRRSTGPGGRPAA